MAYLPYRMYGNGGIHLPIIDIVQTINSTAQVSRVNQALETVNATSAKGLYPIKEKFECGPKKIDRSLKFWKKKSVSCDLLPRESQEMNEIKNHRRVNLSRTRILKCRKNQSQIPSRMFQHERDDCASMGEKKSLQVLFKATKSNGVFDKDGLEEDEPVFSFLWSPFTPSADLKRKASFADYVKMKRKG